MSRSLRGARPSSSTVLLGLATLVALAVSIGMARQAHAQAVVQTITLQPGWNSVHLRVQPDAALATPEQVFDAPGIASVWNWSPRESTLEYIQNPGELDANDPDWLRWIPSEPLLTNLRYVRANHAYLVHYTGGAPVTIDVFGEPRPPRIRWIPDSFHLTGFPVTPAATQTFSEFFEGSRAHRAALVYRLASDRETWELVDPTTTSIEAGVAYWVYSEGGSSHVGALEVRVPNVDRIAFGTVAIEQELEVLNRSSVERTVTFAAEGADAELLLIANRDPDASADQRWLSLPRDVVLQPGESAAVRLGFRRASASISGDYTERLVVTDQLGSYFAYPVTASVEVQPSSLAGLWLGTVVIDAVSGVHAYERTCQQCSPRVDAEGNPTDCPEKGQPAPPGETHYGICLHAEGHPRAGLPVLADPTTPLPVAQPFAYRVLVHVDASDTARLVKEVIQLRRSDTGPGAGEVVLITDENAIPFFQPIALRDGELVGRRISTAAYDFEERTREMYGAFGGVLEVAVLLPADLPTHPMLHRYHPDHDGLDAQYQPEETSLPAHLTEVPAINRYMAFVFDPPDPNGLIGGYGEWSGDFYEEVQGLHKNSIYSTGRFDMKRISFVDELDPAQ
jgi:hypothetical protein